MEQLPSIVLFKEIAMRCSPRDMMALYGSCK